MNFLNWLWCFKTVLILMFTEKHFKLPPKIKFFSNDNEFSRYNVLENTIFIHSKSYKELIFHEWKHFQQQIPWEKSQNSKYIRYNIILNKILRNDIYWIQYGQFGYSPRYAKVFQMYLSEFSFEKEAYLFQIKKWPHSKQSLMNQTHLNPIDKVIDYLNKLKNENVINNTPL